MQHYELDAWLGDAADEITPDQYDTLAAAAEDIAARYPDPDDRDEAEMALTVAFRLLVEDPEAVVDELAAERSRARTAELRALAGLRQAAVTLVTTGGTENRGARGIATQEGFRRRAGMDRGTVRNWIGA